MTRAFTAVPIPEEQTKKLEKIQEDLNVGRPVPTEKMHITFEFFEDLDELEIAEIKTYLESIETQQLNIRIKGLGAFPSKQFVRVLWAGIESENIEDLFRNASDHEVESDNDHKFKPHVTLNRVDQLRALEKKHVHEIMQEYNGKVIGSFQASELVFYESEMTSNGANYRKMYVKNL